MLKVSNETKVGALTAIAITLLILGFNFLKGNSLTSGKKILYAKFINSQDILPSNLVKVNGTVVGSISEVSAETNDYKKIIVSIRLDKSINIPKNSNAVIHTSPLGPSYLEILLGDTTLMAVSGDTIASISEIGIVEKITSKIDPLTNKLEKSLTSLDSLLHNLNATLDVNAQNNLKAFFGNMKTLSASLAVSAASLQLMLNKENGTITNTLKNVESITGNLSNNSEKINGIIENISKTTGQLSEAKIKETIDSLNAMLGQLTKITQKINSGEGSIGALLNDKMLYNNLNAAIRSAQILMDDLRAHPKRYVNISVFGKKDKSGPLMTPLQQDSIK